MSKRRKRAPKPDLFIDESGQLDLVDKSMEQQTLEKIQVECLGMTFEDEDNRREYFLNKLREKLGDSEFRKIEGFPKADDKDILKLSDPPYHTACPNPFLDEILNFLQNSKKENSLDYTKEPFSTDVSEGKNDLVYNAHSYHTKVPYKAVMRYVLHYTKPGDFVLDGFCGTGMTGVATGYCGEPRILKELGYKINNKSEILNENGEIISQVGARFAFLTDLSPVATFIASSYSNLSDLRAFIKEAKSVLSHLEESIGWVYEFDGNRINSAVWSDVFLCPNCGQDIVFWNVARKNGKMQKSFPCPACRSVVGKSASKSTGAVKLERAFETQYDPVLKESVRVPKFVLVEQNVKKGKKRESITLTPSDSQNFHQTLRNEKWPEIPIDQFFPGRQTNKLINGSGISHVCHMYTPRALFVYGSLWNIELSSYRHTSLFRYCLSSINNYISRKQGYFGGGGGVSGTLFTPSIHIERNIFDVLRRKIQNISSISVASARKVFTSTQSTSDLRNLPSDSIDYIFTDPPFGESLQYSELNFFVESWLKVKTVPDCDCVLNYVHKKDISFYAEMMHQVFSEYARVLKPGRWITIEFHNSQNAVWNAIQQSVESAGLIVADVRILDKQQRSFNAVNRSGAVDQDLVISAYKPLKDLEEKFSIRIENNEGVWDFIRMHLKQLPVFVEKNNQAEVIAERQNFLLFDRMVAFHVQRGISVPISAQDFYAGLNQRFPEREGMYFLPEQAAEYDKKRLSVKDVIQLELFIIDEATAIQWLKQRLTQKPQTFQELNPQFMKELGGWQKHEKSLELSELLEQNFIRYNGKEDVPSQIHSYLSTNFKELRKLEKNSPVLQNAAKERWYVPDPNKAGDLEKLRERSLLKEFEEYKESKKKLKLFRLEAVRAGFKKCWQERDYNTIISVAEKIPNNVLEEDPKLLMWYDQAVTRSGGS